MPSNDAESTDASTEEATSAGVDQEVPDVDMDDPENFGSLTIEDPDGDEESEPATDR